MLRIHDHFLLTPSALYMRVSGCSTQVSCWQLNYDSGMVYNAFYLFQHKIYEFVTVVKTLHYGRLAV